MKSKKPHQFNDVSHNVSQEFIDESIANAEERRKQAPKEKTSLSEEQLEDIRGGQPFLITGGIMITDLD
ncbi:hypothetical protein H1P_810017 [Hyella patelloides LEGE 07179]|uniref:Uncharacterized protein n=1 Tax=Hyella patelloides LEGE 07179 TaxID=945734 RepID=A0A563W4F9_9CYAN|nr:hypothetical protein [Hyella patelloides]VEP18555.1 hypothetical protein H1P_810017 [Hyella patelloides LEGE 07179]